MEAARPAASLREKPRSLPSSAAFSSAGRSGEVISQSSCPAKAGHPVLRGSRYFPEGARRTGSSAFADDDVNHCGDGSVTSRHVLVEDLYRVVEADRDQLRDAAFGHGDA